MSSTGKKVIAFDLYGTLLSTDSIDETVATIYGREVAGSLVTAWRRYQLEYTWRLNSMGQYKTFDTITNLALGHAVAEHGLTLTADDAKKLMHAYDALRVFDDVPAAMQVLRENLDAVDVYVFSNGTDDMVGNSIRNSPELGPYADVFRSFVTVDAVKRYKPDPKTYAHLLEQTGKVGHPSDVWVISANAFDIVGARSAGLEAAFIDRGGKGWVDHLCDDCGPSLIFRSVERAVKWILTN